MGSGEELGEARESGEAGGIEGLEIHSSSYFRHNHLQTKSISEGASDEVHQLYNLHIHVSFQSLNRL